MISNILTLVSVLAMASANAPIYCGNSTDQVALVTLTSRASNAAKIDFCSKGSTNIKCSSCGAEVYDEMVTVGIGADVGFLLFAEEWVHHPRTEGLYPNASGGWPRNYTLPKFPTGPQPPDPSKNHHTDGCHSDSDCKSFFGHDKPYCWCKDSCLDNSGQYGGNCTAKPPSNGCDHATVTGVMRCAEDVGMRNSICGVQRHKDGTVTCDGSICMMCTHACDDGRMPGFDCADMLYLSVSCNAPNPTLRVSKQVSC